MKLKLKIIFIVILVTLTVSCNNSPWNYHSKKVLLGSDMLVKEQIDILQNKKIGIISNQSGILSNGTHIVDTLYSLGVNIVALFSPEHGFKGNIQGGHSVNNYKDRLTGLPVFSLFGKTRKPTPEMLQNINLLLFDIQDIGARYYTYISTLYYSMEAAAENGIEFVVLDRPNPINGNKIEGPILNPKFRSFVGIASIPIRHGFTIGEMALYFKYLISYKTNKPVNLKIVKMQNWKRSYYYDQCRLPWKKPSPNIVNVEAEIVYPGMCLLEGTNISEGRGTYTPFIKIGAPFIKSAQLIRELQKLNIKGIEFYPASFIPKTIPGMTKNPKYENQYCFGIKLKITDRKKFESVPFGVHLLYTIKNLYPNKFQIKKNRLDRLFGDTYLSNMLISGKFSYEIISNWKNELTNFKMFRKQFLLYN